MGLLSPLDSLELGGLALGEDDLFSGGTAPGPDTGSCDGDHCIGSGKGETAGSAC